MRRSAVVVAIAGSLVISVLVGLSCAPQGALDISVTELDDGVIVENVGDVDCIVYVSSPEGEQQLELAVGQNTTVTGISQPIEVSAAKL
jgi:hypothetical protein